MQFLKGELNTTMSRLIIWIGLFLVTFVSTGQSVLDRCDYIPPKEANNWQFYYLTGLDFNSNPPQVLSNNNSLSLGKSTASVSDEDGNLLYYTNGQAVWNRNFQMLAHGTNLFGNTGCSQSSVFVQHPLHEVDYYLFTVDLQELPGLPQSGRGFRFSLIDSRMDGGLGDVINPNVQLLEETSEKLTAVQHANGTDAWVITHGWQGTDANTFYAFLIDADGVNTTPVESSLGTPHDGDFESNNSAGYMKVSPDGTKLALAIWGKGVVEIFDFNTTTGEVTNARTSNPDFTYAYGVEFSPDVSRLYVSTTPPINVPKLDSYIYQFNVNDTDPFTNYTEIAVSKDSVFGGLQLGTDGKIYAARYIDIQEGKNALGVIENPNRPGINCNFKEQGLNMGANEVRIGLPNFNTTYLDVPHFKYLNHCYGDETEFSITNYTNIQNQTWDFDDGSNSNDKDPVHVFPEPGNYQVSVTETYSGGQFSASENVTIYPNPDVDLGADTIWLYPGASFTLDAGPGYDYYYWNFSDYPTGQTYIASDTGTYYVTVVDSNCCFNIDSVIIIPSQVYLPNAFTPNNDQLNDVLRPIGPTGGIQNFTLYIFNRWGQLVFESDDIELGWDGTMKNEEAPPGVYVYRLKYDVELDFGKYNNVDLYGHVTLLR